MTMAPSRIGTECRSPIRAVSNDTVFSHLDSSEKRAKTCPKGWIQMKMTNLGTGSRRLLTSIQFFTTLNEQFSVRKFGSKREHMCR